MESEDKYALLAELFPGVPNDVAVNEIATKLAWRDADALSSVSPTWRQAIETRVIYDARVRSHSTETLVVLRIFDNREKFSGLSLYSVRGRTISLLPPIPVHLYSLYEFIAVDGRLYILGGSGGHQKFQNVYVLDLAGKNCRQRPWKRCANMLERRVLFGCCAMDGKIYVFGSACVDDPDSSGFYRGEMYDPKVDAWFALQPAPRWSGLIGTPRLVSVGDELIVLDWFGSRKSHWQVYHPLRDEWRLETHQYRATEYFRSREIEGIDEIPLYDNSGGDFPVYNAETNSWITRCSEFYEGDEPITGEGVELHSILAVDDELLALGSVIMTDESKQYSLFQSNGFGSQEKNTPFLWERLSFVFTCDNDDYSSMCTVQL